MIGVLTLIGGNRFGARAREPRPPIGAARGRRVSAQLADLRRLEEDLERARVRYERAIADYERRTDEIKAGRPPRVSDLIRRRGTSPNGNGARPRLRTVTFDDLRGLGLSMTQSKRVLRYRNEGSVASVADLERVPGIPAVELTDLQRHLRD